MLITDSILLNSDSMSISEVHAVNMLASSEYEILNR